MRTEERVRLLEMKNRRLERLLASGTLALVALGAVAAVKLVPIVAQCVVVKDESGDTKITLSSDGTALIKGRLLVGDTDVIQRLAAVEENWKRSSELSNIKVYTQKNLLFGSKVGVPALKNMYCASTTGPDTIDLNAPELRPLGYEGPLLQPFGKKIVFCYMYPESPADGQYYFYVAEAVAEGNRVKFRLQGNPDLVGVAPMAVNFRVVVGYVPNP